MVSEEGYGILRAIPWFGGNCGTDDISASSTRLPADDK